MKKNNIFQKKKSLLNCPFKKTDNYSFAHKKQLVSGLPPPHGSVFYSWGKRGKSPSKIFVTYGKYTKSNAPPQENPLQHTKKKHHTKKNKQDLNL